jgi:hypothetical protein
MLGKLVVFTLGVAAGVIGKTIYDDGKANCTSCSDTLEAVLLGFKNGWDKFREGFKEGFERHAS